ncbi:DVU0298 family protein [Desulfovulcanus sp.]
MQTRISNRALKKEVFSILGQDNIGDHLSMLLNYPLRRVVNPLFSALLSPDPKIKWHSVTAFGFVVDQIAKESIEEARIIMRRFMWMLNDESGGIGWGAPEAMGEVMAWNQKLAMEFHPILISYLLEDEQGKDNFLEYAPLRRGAFWGLARLAQTRPELAKKAQSKIISALGCEDDAYILIYILLYIQLFGGGEIKQHVQRLLQDERQVEVYWDQKFSKVTVRGLASQVVEENNVKL